MTHAPERGDIILIEISPRSGSKMTGSHRVLVLSVHRFSVSTGRVVASPITAEIKGSPFEVQFRRGLNAHGC